MQRYSTCGQENAQNLYQSWNLAQDNDANDGGRGWQEGEQERKEKKRPVAVLGGNATGLPRF